MPGEAAARPLSGPDSAARALLLRADRKVLALVQCLRARGAVPRRILVVGCGSGREAGILARSFGAECLGVDLPDSNLPFEPAAAAPARLLHMDASSLGFASASFDLVYSFHALEHMAAPLAALAEMARVLQPGGTYCIGTPNSSRLVGYVGSPEPLSVRIRWNLDDLRMRLSGRWSNEAGAHAGYRAEELVAMCRRAFGTAEEISDGYYAHVYASRAGLLDLIRRSGAKRLVYPCVYVAGRRT